MKENTGDLKEQMYSWILAEMEQAEAAGLMEDPILWQRRTSSIR